jgi:putative transposase
VPKGLIRIYGQGDWHYITCSCYGRLPMLGSAESRDLFLQILEETRKKYAFVVAGYVVMPEHIHMLMGEPKVGNPSVVMKILKQRVSLRSHEERMEHESGSQIDGVRPFWLPRFYDFNVATKRKYLEKLNYMHFNPVKRGLVKSPELWCWSSFRHYWYGEEGPVKIGE